MKPSSTFSSTGLREEAPPATEAAAVAPDRARPAWLNGQVWLLALPVLVLVAGAWSHRWVAEDAFINFRVVDVTLHGGSPLSFNPGQRVEAGTSPLWIAVLVTLEVGLGWLVTLEWLSLLTGLALTVAGLVAAIAAGTLLVRRSGESGRLWPAGALVLVVLPPFWDFASSGLETGLTFAWLGGSYWLLVRRYARGFDTAAAERPAPWSPWWLPVVLGLGPLIRPDLALFSAGFLLTLVVLSRSGHRGRIGALALALAAAAPGAFQIFRMAYFGALVPNTALAKEASVANWAKGLAYLDNYTRTYLLVVPLAVLAWWATRWVRQAAARVGPEGPDGLRRRRHLLVLVGTPAAVALLHALYVTRVGGDFMHGRLLLPATFGLLLPAAVLPVVPRAGRAPTTAVAAGALAAWALVCGLGLRLTDQPPAHWSDIFDERAWWAAQAERDNAVTLEDHERVFGTGVGRQARQRAAEGADVLVRADGEERPLAPGSGVVLEASTIGLSSMSAGPDVFVFDTVGLGDAFGSRITADPDGRIGHQKRLQPAFLYALLPLADDDAVPDEVDRVTLAAARAALRCPAVEEVFDATRDPLTPGRMLTNVVRAPKLTGLRVPADPVAAASCP